MNAQLPDSFYKETMLVGLKISSWSASKKDNDATHEVANNHLAEVQMGSYSKKLLSKGALDGIKKVERDLKQEWKKLTLPWTDEGYRIASNDAYFKLSELYRDAQIQHAVEVKKFLGVYAEKKQEAKAKLGTLYREEEYPELSDLESKFDIDMPLRKTPESSDLKNKLVTADRNRNEESLKKATEAAVRDIYERFSKQLVHINDKLKTYKDKEPDAKKCKTFHDTLISNMNDLIDLLPILNVTQDPELDKLAARIKNEVCRFGADVLKEDEEARKEVIEQTDKIINDMKAFFA